MGQTISLIYSSRHDRFKSIDNYKLCIDVIYRASQSLTKILGPLKAASQ